MKIIRNPEIMKRYAFQWKRQGKSVGFVPTMGALHEGHLSLVRRARRENKIVVASIFVNPLQFGPREDFKKYPRPVAKDKKLLAKEKVDFLFMPSAVAMYSTNLSSPNVLVGDPKSGFPAKASGNDIEILKNRGQVRSAMRTRPLFLVEPPSQLTRILCGKSRPGHFQGVATVVAKLFMIVQPARAYFGAKDYQQTVVIRRLIEDLHFDVELKVLPTIREKDGLAMSSRNRYLGARDHERAQAISQTLFWLRDQIRSGRRDLETLKKEAARKLKSKVDRLDYFEIADPDSLQSLKKIQPRMVALAACFVGKTRLIDNVIIRGK